MRRRKPQEPRPIDNNAPAVLSFASGSVASRLLMNRFDVGSMRPYYLPDGRQFITRHRPVFNRKTGLMTLKSEAVPVQNANATLLKDEWIVLDTAVMRASVNRLRAVADIRGRGLELTLPNGMSKTVLQSQAQSDISGASISMTGIARSKGDRPLYDLTSLPLPIIHKDFQFPARELAVSRNGSMPLDTSTAELAARRVAEGAEQLLLGTAGSYAYGGGTVYGFTNYPNRITKVLSSPLASGWIPKNTFQDVLDMRQSAANALHRGPFVLYVSQRWDEYLDLDYNSDAANASNVTLRERIARISNIDDIVTVDFLHGYDMVLVQMTSDVVREVVGMDVTTVQWETEGGMQVNFKVMAILVPQMRKDFNGLTGIVHGSVAGQTTAPQNELLLEMGVS